MTALDPLDPSPGLPADVDLAAACGSWQRGLADCRAVFHLRLGRSPVAGGYALVAGLEHALRSLQAWSFGDDVLARLAALHGADGQPRFPAGFLGYLAATPFGLDMDAVPEGTAVFPHAPLLRVEGPLAQARLVGAALREVIASRTLALTGTSGAAAPAQSALGATYELTGLQREGRWSWLLPPA
jgi:nicotinate phosphoribosyltransferase